MQNKWLVVSAYHRNSFKNEYVKPLLDLLIETDHRLGRNKLVNVLLLKKERKVSQLMLYIHLIHD